MNHYENRRLFGSWYIPDINKPIGIGSFGRVYELRSYVDPDDVTAVKIISIPKDQDEYNQQIGKPGVSKQKVQDDFRQAKDALINELRMMKEVNGYTNCVGCRNYSVEEHEEGFGWDILIQMEKLESLDSYFRRKGEIYDTDIIQLGIAMCEALKVCELNHIVHRDIKPTNIMVKNINGKAIYKLGDFGVARTLSDSGTMTIAGTFGYMAPELLRGEGDLRVDIYSLGMVMYELLNANRLPFLPDYPQELKPGKPGKPGEPGELGDIQKAQIKWNRDIPKPEPLYSMGTELAKVVVKACEYDRDKRYHSATEMLDDLQKVLAENKSRLIFTVPSIGAYKPSERKVLVKIYGSCETAVYDGREHRAEGFTSNAESHNVKVQLAPGSTALAKGTKAGKYRMGLTKESFLVSSGDSRLEIEDVVVQDGVLTIEKAPAEKAKKKPVKAPGEPKKEPSKPTKRRGWLILACLAAVIIAVGGFFISANMHSEDGPFTAISAGDYYTVGIQEDGTVVVKGDNDRVRPIRRAASRWTDIAAISTGEYHAVGLKSDGTVVAAGENSYGRCDVSDWEDIVAIAASVGGRHTVGLKSDGTVVAVGDNFYGQCDVSAWTDIVAISAGYGHTVGLKSDGTVVAVGYDARGELDVSGWTDIVAISAGGHHTFGLKSDGTVVATEDTGETYAEYDVSDWTNIVAISTGSTHTVGLKSDGTVVSTGLINESEKSDIFGWTDIVAISAGSNLTVGVKSDGTVVATEDYYNGEGDVTEWRVLLSSQQARKNRAVQERAEVSAPAEAAAWSPDAGAEAIKVNTPEAVPPTPQNVKPTGFEYELDGGEIVITKYTGNGANVEIPKEIDGMPVTKIEKYAFARSETLKSVTIPYGVTEIGEHAFHRSEKLESVELPDSVTEIGKCAFFGCLNLKSVSLPEGLKTIEESCFEKCEALQSAYIPDTVTEIKRYAFLHCYDLASVNIPDGVAIIGKSAFYECNAMDSISVPANAEIGDKAFYGIGEVIFVD